MTTGYNPEPDAIERAKRLAGELDADYVPRRQSSLPRLRKQHGHKDAIVVLGREVRYVPETGEPLVFHPGTSIIRVKRLLKGQSDPMLDLAGVLPGDRVLDCTAGLAGDSIVFSARVGETGRVTALESDRTLYTLVREGIALYAGGPPEFAEAMRRIDLRHADHLAFLREQPDNSYDVVYFDPMFRSPVEESSSIRPLRPLANPEPVSAEAVAEAVRVARRAVMLKERRDSGEFERLGFTPHVRAHSQVAYGVIAK
ncbi:class I SAM-dependent methyltransferase [Paenibacillus thermoaerophilus]|uniref:Class I SAM-dependent methyltransferase n=1 Tax=Paenibacillus thermoaerophilus TaxID=1215385 RepID=A0ABW2V6Y2_9BACL